MFVSKQMYSKQTMILDWELKRDEINSVHWQEKTQNL